MEYENSPGLAGFFCFDRWNSRDSLTQWLGTNENFIRAIFYLLGANKKWLRTVKNCIVSIFPLLEREKVSLLLREDKEWFGALFLL